LDKKSKKINLNDVDMTDVDVVSTENIDINEYYRNKLIECIAKEENRLFLFDKKISDLSSIGGLKYIWLIKNK